MANKQIVLGKEEAVNSLASSMNAAKSYVVCAYAGLTVLKLEELRHALRKENCFLKVVPNNVIKRAAQKEGFDQFNDVEGPTCVIVSNNDSVDGPKIAAEFAKKNKQLVMKNGVVDGQYCTEAEMAQVAKLPSRIAMIAMLAGGLYQPLQQLALGLNMVTEKEE